MEDELPIGRRVAYWRGRRKLSQQVFGDRIGKSKSWVDKVERGERRLDKYSVVHTIAGALGISVEVLLGGAEGTARVTPTEPIDLDEIRRTLSRFAPATYLKTGPLLHELEQSVTHAWLTFQYGRYDVLVRALPRLLRDVRAAEAHHSGDNRVRAGSLVGQVYQVMSSVTRKLGAHDLARLTAERSIEAALRVDDPLLAGTGTTRFANALLAAGDVRAAFEANIVMANRLAPNGATWADADRVSVYGSLLLQAAMAAAHLGDNASVRELLREAKVAATAVGHDDNRYRTSFGPTNVELHRTAAAVELGEGRQAIAIHDALPPRPFAALMPERRAHALLDVARAYVLVGDLTRAGDALLEGDRHAPAEIRTRPMARDVMSAVLRGIKGSPPVLVAELADRMGARV
ncbi:helix-turn-helix domain-containing protein [Micromonospora sp. NPDC004704]